MDIIYCLHVALAACQMSMTSRDYTTHPVYSKLHSKRQRPYIGHVQACLCGAFPTLKCHQYSPKKCQYEICSNIPHVCISLIATTISAPTTLLVVVVVVVTLAHARLTTVTTLLATVTTLLATVTSLHTLLHHGVTATKATLLTIPSATHTLLTITSTTHTLLTITTASSIPTCIARKMTKQISLYWTRAVIKLCATVRACIQLQADTLNLLQCNFSAVSCDVIHACSLELSANKARLPEGPSTKAHDKLLQVLVRNSKQEQREHKVILEHDM